MAALIVATRVGDQAIVGLLKGRTQPGGSKEDATMAPKNGKVVLITGANKGLGKEIGSELVRSDTRWSSRRETSRRGLRLRRNSWLRVRRHTVRLEVTNPDHIASLVSYLETTFGKLDVLVNNAGIALEWDGKPTNAGDFVEPSRSTSSPHTRSPRPS